MHTYTHTQIESQQVMQHYLPILHHGIVTQTDKPTIYVEDYLPIIHCGIVTQTQVPTNKSYATLPTHSALFRSLMESATRRHNTRFLHTNSTIPHPVSWNLGMESTTHSFIHSFMMRISQLKGRIQNPPQKKPLNPKP
jgi:hypothetical protein